MTHSKPEVAAMPEQPKPSLYLTDEEITGLGSVEIGDRLTLSIKSRVTALREENMEGKSKHLSLTLEILDASVEGKNGVKQR